MAGKKWTAIVLTCQDKDRAQAYQHELCVRQEKQFIDKDVILLTVEDPMMEAGSGGATLNALLVVTEHLSAKQGFTVVNPDVLHDAHILIIHMGRNYPFDSCGRAFACLPMTWAEGQFPASGLISNIDVLLYTMSHKVAVDSSPGVWVCSSDMILDVPDPCHGLTCKGSEAMVLTVPGSVTYAKDHGVYKLAADGRLLDIIYKGTTEEIKSCCIPGTEMVPLVAGVVFLGRQVAEILLGFHTMHPLVSCCYLGLDSGFPPIRLSLFFDFMLAMCQNVTEEEFISGEKMSSFGKVVRGENKNGDDDNNNKIDIDNNNINNNKIIPANSERALQLDARRLIWRELRHVVVNSSFVSGGSHNYMNMSPITHHKHMSKLPLHDYTAYQKSGRVHSVIQPSAQLSPDCVILNSAVGENAVIGSGAVVSHCRISPGLKVGSNCILNGVHMSDEQICEGQIPDNLIVQEHIIHLPTMEPGQSQRIRTVFGRLDDLTNVNVQKNTFCNQSLDEFGEKTGIDISDVWDSATPPSKRTLLNARLFPLLDTSEDLDLSDVLWLSGSNQNSKQDYLKRWKRSLRLSLEEVMSFVDVAAEFKKRRELYFTVAETLVKNTLLKCEDGGWNIVYASAAVEGYSHRMLEMLDEVAQKTDSAGVAARTLANIADVLGKMAQSRGGLRSGPASNKQWQLAFDLLEKNRIPEGIQLLAKEREKWLDRPDRLIRAARHYEGAGQILIRHAVMTARKFMKLAPCEPSPVEKWVTAECPARVDCSGCWSDTPPVTYEHGGAVMNVAVKVDGKKPLGARVKRIEEPKIIVQLGRTNRVTNRMVLTEIEQFEDYCRPHASGALLKAAFICAEIIEYPSATSLKDQLLQKYGGGFELHSWSELPQGSGLGTSSILAGTIMAALLRASGRKFDLSSLNHAVLHLEQMLTTGGGWQDQVGGLVGGVKVGHSKAELPLKVEMTFPKISAENMQAFNDRMVLVYTGIPRLARDLLQTVVRNWYARNPDIVETVDQLVINAWRCSECLENGDIKGVGDCMNTYWEQKKKMASGSEPQSVIHLMKALRPYSYGQFLTGAGGGGFLLVLTKEPNALDTVKNTIARTEEYDKVSTTHSCSIDHEGLTLHVEDSGYEELEIYF